MSRQSVLCGEDCSRRGQESGDDQVNLERTTGQGELYGRMRLSEPCCTSVHKREDLTFIGGHHHHEQRPISLEGILPEHSYNQYRRIETPKYL